jgi:S-adenosylmethionine-diacylglycerol 3-amino-3-carboxypropyl transferase
MTSFCRKINYSSSNEDSLSEIKALKICETDRVLCITGSGARPLDLLIAKPAEIVSLDFNPCQNHLLELKMRAIAGLDHEDFLEFMGVRPSNQRAEIYQGLREGISAEARNFWDGNIRMIRKGVIYQGGWEKYFKQLALVIGLVRKSLLQAIFSSREPGRQARLWSEVWDSAEWRIFLRLVSQRVVWKYIFRDPGFYRYVSEDFSIYDYLENRFEHAFKTVRLRESAFAALLFWGRFHEALPLYLQKESYETLRKNLHRIRFVTRPLGNFLDECKKNSFNKYSLSDFSSYTDEREYERIWHGVLRTATVGARICERQFLVKKNLPAGVQPHVRRESRLENELEETDDSIFFSFVVAEVRSEAV